MKDARLFELLCSSFLLPFLLANCSCDKQQRPTRNVDTRIILPPAAERVQVHEHEKLLLPAEVDTDSPVYPDLPGQLESNLVVICADVAIGTEGDVLSVNQVQGEPDCEAVGTRNSQTYFPSVSQAVMKWNFIPALICHFDKDDSECDADDARLKPTIVRLTFKFEFTFKKGRRLVRKFSRSHSGQ